MNKILEGYSELMSYLILQKIPTFKQCKGVFMFVSELNRQSKWINTKVGQTHSWMTTFYVPSI